MTNDEIIKQLDMKKYRRPCESTFLTPLSLASLGCCWTLRASVISSGGLAPEMRRSDEYMAKE